MEKKDNAEDTRLCEIAGPAFDGIENSVAHKAVTGTPGTTKVLMVHGISKHLPGYSARLREKLAASLGLDSMDPTIKDITLTNAPTVEKMPAHYAYRAIFPAPATANFCFTN